MAVLARQGRPVCRLSAAPVMTESSLSRVLTSSAMWSSIRSDVTPNDATVLAVRLTRMQDTHFTF